MDTPTYPRILRFLSGAILLPAMLAGPAPAAPSDPAAWTEQKSVTLTWKPETGAAVAFTLVTIHPGTFTMGSPSDETDRTPGEGPQTRVTLTRMFWLGQTEVTQEQWDAVLGAKSNPSNFKGPKLPVDRTTFD